MVKTGEIKLKTSAGYEVEDITRRVAQEVENSGLKDGTVTLFVIGSTAALSTIEYEPGLVADLRDFFQRSAPEGIPYHHDAAWHDGNGHAHVRATLMGPSLTVPFCAGKLTLGTWQQIIFVDFDVPARERRIVVQVIGE